MTICTSILCLYVKLFAIAYAKQKFKCSITHKLYALSLYIEQLKVYTKKKGLKRQTKPTRSETHSYVYMHFCHLNVDDDSSGDSSNNGTFLVFFFLLHAAVNQ